MAEQRLHRVEPRAVLGVEEDVRPLSSGLCNNPAVVVDAGVVEEEHHPRAFEGSSGSETAKDLVKEVLKHRGVDPAFDNLCTDNCLLGDGGEEAERVGLKALAGIGSHRQGLSGKAVAPQPAGPPLAGELQRAGK